ncbi:MAG: C-GCAxxG-C-C family protein [Candidatus Margulisbacteria bacterium]|nr:C-GCAxxG-C-C family protein [Candidatus Margulisiibacteriota bacterium]MBU1022251.1 C-GCAxxG-C-C family protein [Candidatus Margulisiibacteriota bacterium]MBU1729310.1 C-GCAxxG-C-C family protein [Candidatus Margulisiibacteriota bacterium]MBU1955583.1 C-GCAxxG-C-C family protein [Candidatus Margulisiibacteriota bacterium]
MPIEKAKKHYLGKDNHERLNCAESILRAFPELSKDAKDSLCKGGGRAPGGKCGAYCAAKFILEKHAPEKLKEFENYFKNLAGSLKCDEIRRNRKLSCLGCVEKAAEYLHQHSS